jgi:Gpi18-like mannosyltransferase
LALLLAFPGSAFSLVVYAEPLFLALTLGGYMLALRGRHAVAGAAGFLAGATKPQGFLLAVAMGIETLRERRDAKGRLHALLAAGAPLGGLAAVALLNGLTSDSFFTFVSVQSE